MSAGLFPTLIRQLRRPLGADPPADAELVRRFASTHDAEAFTELLRRHGPLVWGVCRRRLPNRADAEDAFQSTFLVLAKRAASVRRPQALGCWLYGVAHRVAGRMRSRSMPILSEPASTAAPVSESATMREFLTALDEELLRLPEKLRGPLVLCFLQERTQDEAAKQLGVSLSTLKRRLDTGRELLRVRLNGRGVDLSAVLAAVGLAVPAAVADAAARAAVDGIAAGLISANVLSVTEGVIRAMTYTKLKAWTAGVLMASVTVGGTGYFAATGVGQTGSSSGGSTPKKTSQPDPADVAEILKAEADVKVAELEVVRSQAKLRENPNDRVIQAEIQVAEARLVAARAQLEAAKARVARQRDAELNRQQTESDLRELNAILEREQAARTDPKRLLLQEKLTAARRVLEMETRNTVAGRSVASVYTWSKRVMDAEREVDPSAATRTKSARDHFDRMKKLEDALKRAAGGVSQVEQAETTYYRAEAESWFKEAETPQPAPKEKTGAADVEKLRLDLEEMKRQAATERDRAEHLMMTLKKLNNELDELRRSSQPKK